MVRIAELEQELQRYKHFVDDMYYNTQDYEALKERLLAWKDEMKVDTDGTQ